MAFSVYSAAQLLSQPIGGRLGDRIGWRPLIVPGLLFGALGVYLWLIAQGWGILYLGAAIAGTGTAVARIGLDTIMFNGAPDELRGTAAGLQYASFDIWNGTMAWGLGFLVTRTSYETIYTIMALIPLLWAILMWFIIPRGSGRVSGQPAFEPGADR